MPTIKDVAKACGVSTATVSYVLNGKSRLPQETRDRVMRMVRELNYHPSAVARGLSHKRLNTVGIVFGVIDSVAIITHPYASHILQGVITVASEKGFNVTFYTHAWRTASRSAAAYTDRRTDGLVVVAPPLDSDIIPGLAKHNIPMVAVSYPGGEFDIPSVDTDNASAIEMAYTHLRQLGHTRIAHLAGQENLVSGVIRARAFRELVAADGIELAPEYTGPGTYIRAPAYAEARRLLMLPHPPTAIIAGNDMSALGVMDAARDLGISVPVRLSVVGIDDAPEGMAHKPALTSVRQPLDEIGQAAMTLLAEQINDGRGRAQQRLLQPRLIIRESTAPPVI